MEFFLGDSHIFYIFGIKEEPNDDARKSSDGEFGRDYGEETYQETQRHTKSGL